MHICYWRTFIMEFVCMSVLQYGMHMSDYSDERLIV